MKQALNVFVEMCGAQDFTFKHWLVVLLWCVALIGIVGEGGTILYYLFAIANFGLASYFLQTLPIRDDDDE